MILERYKPFLDMFCVDLDGSHTTVHRGGECYGYQGRKKRKTTNGICTTDRQGIQIAMSTPVSGTHNDLHNISAVLGGILHQPQNLCYLHIWPLSQCGYRV